MFLILGSRVVFLEIFLAVITVPAIVLRYPSCRVSASGADGGLLCGGLDFWGF